MRAFLAGRRDGLGGRIIDVTVAFKSLGLARSGFGAAG